MRKIQLGFLVFFGLLITLSACESFRLSPTPVDVLRNPASTGDLVHGSQAILRDLNDDQIFNPRTCSAYVKKLTTNVFSLPSDYFEPKNDAEKALLRQQGVQVLKDLFQSRVVLREKLQQFDAQGNLDPECISAVRDSFQYLRFAEEFLLEWLVQEKVVANKSTPILDNEAPYTMTNPKYEGFKLKSGDIMVVRGKSYVSAMIARIGDDEGNFSHLAIVGEDAQGRQYAVEAEIAYGTIVTPLEKWRQSPDARIALYRQKDAALAREAARKIYDRAMAAINQGATIPYNFTMDDSDNRTFFCSQVGEYAYSQASHGSFVIPKYKTQISKFKDTSFLKNMGITVQSLFAPYDMEVEPRFDLVAEYRYLPLLRQVRMQDSILQSVYSWMIDKKYDYHFALSVNGEAVLAKVLRDFGLLKDQMPTYMPENLVKVTLQFRAVTSLLEKNLYKIEGDYFKEHNHSLTFKDMLAINEAYRLKDCLAQREYIAEGERPYMQSIPDTSSFHWFFYNDDHRCQ